MGTSVRFELPAEFNDVVATFGREGAANELQRQLLLDLLAPFYAKGRAVVQSDFWRVLSLALDGSARRPYQLLCSAVETCHEATNEKDVVSHVHATVRRFFECPALVSSLSLAQCWSLLSHVAPAASDASADALQVGHSADTLDLMAEQVSTLARALIDQVNNAKQVQKLLSSQQKVLHAMLSGSQRQQQCAQSLVQQCVELLMPTALPWLSDKVKNDISLLATVYGTSIEQPIRKLSKHPGQFAPIGAAFRAVLKALSPLGDFDDKARFVLHRTLTALLSVWPSKVRSPSEQHLRLTCARVASAVLAAATSHNVDTIGRTDTAERLTEMTHKAISLLQEDTCHTARNLLKQLLRFDVALVFPHKVDDTPGLSHRLLSLLNDDSLDILECATEELRRARDAPAMLLPLCQVASRSAVFGCSHVSLNTLVQHTPAPQLAPLLARMCDLWPSPTADRKSLLVMLALVFGNAVIVETVAAPVLTQAARVTELLKASFSTLLQQHFAEVLALCDAVKSCRFVCERFVAHSKGEEHEVAECREYFLELGVVEASSDITLFSVCKDFLSRLEGRMQDGNENDSSVTLLELATARVVELWRNAEVRAFIVNDFDVEDDDNDNDNDDKDEDKMCDDEDKDDDDSARSNASSLHGTAQQLRERAAQLAALVLQLLDKTTQNAPVFLHSLDVFVQASEFSQTALASLEKKRRKKEKKLEKLKSKNKEKKLKKQGKKLQKLEREIREFSRIYPQYDQLSHVLSQCLHSLPEQGVVDLFLDASLFESRSVRSLLLHVCEQSDTERTRLIRKLLSLQPVAETGDLSDSDTEDDSNWSNGRWGSDKEQVQQQIVSLIRNAFSGNADECDRCFREVRDAARDLPIRLQGAWARAFALNWDHLCQPSLCTDVESRAQCALVTLALGRRQVLRLDSHQLSLLLDLVLRLVETADSAECSSTELTRETAFDLAYELLLALLRHRLSQAALRRVLFVSFS
ncbi:MAG: hypothetical protein MHM6MM_005046 [Cercozoa sp. M6MM]